ncbi:WSC domain-containing protein 2 [Holothuria leucospilota]|uniref:WSC domain-containing protein 2 n=1 Tax=Holothuria leucospilota TaxID=206669 RepID=A0A9Q1HH36_HOLLE|nr:WSC domain-containing protein 2 [Holothuria leucospilota]
MALRPHGHDHCAHNTESRRTWRNSNAIPSRLNPAQQDQKSIMMLIQSYLYVLMASIVIMFYIYVYLDHHYFSKLRASNFSTERTTNPTRYIANTVDVVRTLATPTNQLSHREVINRMSLNLSLASKEQYENRTNPVYLGANRSICDVNTQFMPAGSMPLVALVSAPGSGNTWLRYLIEKATGIYTGSVYNDKALLRGGFLGESEDPRSGRVVVIKMHKVQNIRSIKAELDGIVLLIRNPYSAIVSDFNRLVAHNTHKGIAPAEAFNTSYWAQFVTCSAQRWQTIARYCIELPVRKLVVYYEDLLTDLPQQLRRVVSFLGLLVDENKIKCAFQDNEGILYFCSLK